MTAVDILLYIQRLWQNGYQDFPNLRGLSPVQVLTRLPAQNERYQRGEAGLRAVLHAVARQR